MHENIQLIHRKWQHENYKPGAFGSIVRDYLNEHPTTLIQYEEFIERWRMPQEAGATLDSSLDFEIEWYLPSLVENLQDWSYAESIFNRNMIKSLHPGKWLCLIPHAFSRMPLFDLASACAWEPQIKNYPDDIRRSFYQHLDVTASKTFVAIELGRSSLQDINIFRLNACLNPNQYTVHEKRDGKPWDAIGTLLQNNDWQYQDYAHFKELCDKWIRHAPMHDLMEYTKKATALLGNIAIQWHLPCVDNFVCRMRGAEEDGSRLLHFWTKFKSQHQDNKSKLPWKYVLQKWTTWETSALLNLIIEKTEEQQSLQELVLEHPDYTPIIKREILLYRCENDLISLRDIAISKNMQKPLQSILMFWLVYNKPALEKEFIQVFQRVYMLHPIYEHERIMAQYLPGLSSIKTSLHAMNIPWRQALTYAEQAMRSKSDTQAVVKKELEWECIDGFFESAV